MIRTKHQTLWRNSEPWHKRLISNVLAQIDSGLEYIRALTLCSLQQRFKKCFTGFFYYEYFIVSDFSKNYLCCKSIFYRQHYRLLKKTDINTLFTKADFATLDFANFTKIESCKYRKKKLHRCLKLHCLMSLPARSVSIFACVVATKPKLLTSAFHMTLKTIC